MEYDDIAGMLPSTVRGWSFRLGNEGSFSFEVEGMSISGTCGSPNTAIDDIRRVVSEAACAGDMFDALVEEVLSWEQPSETDKMDCPICGYPLGDEGNIELAAKEDGVLSRVYSCPKCFFAAFGSTISTFWGFQRKMRDERREEMFGLYREVLDNGYEEACDD